MIWLITIGLFALASLGIVLPILIHRRVIVSRPWSHGLALLALFLVSGLVTLIVYLAWHVDPGVIFTRVFLVDGISLYILSNAPATSKKEDV